MYIPPCFYRLSVKALVLDEQRRFLLAKEEDGVWDFPGGGLEFGEDPVDALKREVYEELGVNVLRMDNNPSYFIAYKKNGSNAWMANIFYKSTLENLDFKKSDECVELKFFDAKEAAKLKNNGGITEFIKNYDTENHNL